ncbi:MAG TPA: HAD hydrolase-like protein [Terriglobales bacterium]|nr:HAD hydrolase-like protein [Terriglobales bacterium]
MAFDFFAADAYLFDIDGTLLNTRDAIHYYAFRNALREVFRFDATIDGVPVHGNTDIGILRAVCRLQGISDADFDRELPKIVSMMSDEVHRRIGEMTADLCPSILELLTRLKDEGKLIGVVTGNFEAIGWAKLSAGGLRKFFDFGAFSNHAERRADIFRNGLAEVHRRLGPGAKVFIVGDTPSDIHAAKEVGVPIISVSTGIFPKAQLEALGPDVSVSCCTDLLGLQPAQ